MHAGTCPSCGNGFESKKPKRFCSVRCRARSPEFIEIAKANAEKARAARRHTRPTRACENPDCRKKFDCQPARATRFCSRACWRDNRVRIFDSAIATPADFKAIECFDEYLTQERLECPMLGCNWAGDSLGHHLAERHGVSAERFKEIAGFNASTALITPRLAKTLSARRRDLKPILKRGRGPGKGSGALRPEGQKHFEQAMELRRAAAHDTDGTPAE